jgi:hypothetical protein
MITLALHQLVRSGSGGEAAKQQSPQRSSPAGVRARQGAAGKRAPWALAM